MILNETTITELKDVMGDGFRELLDVFVVDVTQHLIVLDALVTAGDIAGLERPAHAIKGASANLGAINLTNAAAELVAQSRIGNVPNPAQSVAHIRDCFEQVRPQLIKLRD